MDRWAVVEATTTGLARRCAALVSRAGVGGAAFRINHPSPVTVWLGHMAVIMAVIAMSLVIGRAVFAPVVAMEQRRLAAGQPAVLDVVTF